MANHHQKRGVMSRADMLALIARGEADAVNELAERLGLQKKALNNNFDEVEVEIPARSEREQRVLQSDFRDDEFIKTEDATNLRARYWRLIRRDDAESRDGQDEKPKPKSEKQARSILESFWHNRPVQPPKFELLVDPNTFLPTLMRTLKVVETGARLDVEEAVSLISRGQTLSEMPRRKERQLNRHLHIIDDRHLHLVPYWTDHSVYAHLIQNRLPHYAHSRSVLVAGHSRPQVPIDHPQTGEWLEPPERSVVLIFSDLGALSNYGYRQKQAWLQIVNGLKRRGCHLVAVVPCSVDEVDNSLAAQIELISWDSAFKEEQLNIGREQEASILVKALAPAVRIEPGLIRSMRLGLNRLNLESRMDASIEALVWQHPFLQERHSVAATPDTRKTERTALLNDFEQLDEKFRQRSLSVIRSWRWQNAGLSEHIWFEEISSLEEQSRQWLTEDCECANAWFQACAEIAEAAKDGVYDAIPSSIKAWLQRATSRMPDKTGELSYTGEALQRLAHALDLKDEQGQHHLSVDPQKTDTSNQEEKRLMVYQYGQSVALGMFKPFENGNVAYSTLSLLSYKGKTIRFEAFVGNERKDKFSKTIELSEGDPIIIDALPIADVDEFTIKSDLETLHFKQEQRPSWAVAYGRDSYGLYADLEYESVVQRMRWIPPGRFMMGSPESEKGRYPWEDLHPAILNQGFWLGDTAVTQAFYQAVIGKNPSEFKGKNNPVENVDWNAAKSFCKKLNKKMGIQPLRFQLPTDAQWEYACRAGTQSPFHFGDEVSLEDTNYRGIWEWDSSKWGEGALQQTAEVRSYSPNQFGLYEMHGNVWEWCEDEWNENLGSELQVDPYFPGSQESEHRVVRGGSWDLVGRDLRSACRGRRHPGGRSLNRGFRLALGPELQATGGASRDVSRSDEQASRERAQQQADAQQQSGGVDWLRRVIKRDKKQ